MRNREVIKTAVLDRLRREFPTDMVDVTDGYQNNIHVMVVSRRFDAMRERDKQDLLWGLVDDAWLEEAGKQLISLILPVSPGEVRPLGCCGVVAIPGGNRSGGSPRAGLRAGSLPLFSLALFS